MKKTIDFLKFRYLAFGLSISIIIIFSIITYMHGGFNLGIDFAGGVKATIKFEKGVTIGKIRSVLNENNINATVQQVGEDYDNKYMIGTRLLGKGETSEKTYEIMKEALRKEFKIEELGVETIGPAIGGYLRKSTFYSFIIVVILQTLYLAFRFEFKFSLAAVLSLVHDVLIGFAFCGMAKIELSIPVVAALLTMFGYSGNDTIVVFDRIRENMKMRSKETFFEVINTSITQTISRTILTSFTVLIAVLAIFFLAGESLRDFSKIFLLGIFEGVYSTIFIASPIVLIYEKLTIRQK